MGSDIGFCGEELWSELGLLIYAWVMSTGADTIRDDAGRTGETNEGLACEKTGLYRRVSNARVEMWEAGLAEDAAHPYLPAIGQLGTRRYGGAEVTMEWRNGRRLEVVQFIDCLL